MTPGELPIFTYQGVALDYAGLRYNPCNDVIFPSVVRAEGCLRDAPANWLMYYSPHNAPGGICLAAADRLDGQWREFGDSPLIGCDWPPHHSVSHVSSPHAVYNAEEERLFLYYHGENSTTRYATSQDGVHFEYGGICVTQEMYPDTTGAFYARVFPTPEGDPARRWVMFLMGHIMANDEAAIFAAWSPDGRSWATVPEPLVRAGRGNSVCAPWLARIGDRDILLCHADRPMGAGGNRFDPHTDIVAYEMTAELSHAEWIGPLLTREAISPDNARASDPCLVEHDGRFWLFHTIGRRLNQRIAVSTADCIPHRVGMAT